MISRTSSQLIHNRSQSLELLRPYINGVIKGGDDFTDGKHQDWR